MERPQPAEPMHRNAPADAAVGTYVRSAVCRGVTPLRWWAPTRSAARRAHQWLTLAGLGVASLVALMVQAGMSERLRTTWHRVNALDRAISATMPGAGLFRALVSLVPRRLPPVLPAAGSSASASLMAMWGYFGAMVLLFALYALALWWTARLPTSTSWRRGLCLIGGFGVLFSTVAFFTPAAPSHDPVAYAMSGRLMTVYHANPFFTTPGRYPHDPILAPNEWPHSATAYGPLWSVLSVLLAPVVGADPLHADFVYRLVGYAAQIANLLLVAALLRRLAVGDARWHALGLLAYAWNPLILVEVAAGHNDVLVLTGVLAGLSLLLRQRVALAMLALGATLLLKASAVPLVLLILLAWWLQPAPRGADSAAGAPSAWLRRLGPVGLVAGVVVVGYLPFLWGHSLRQVIASFSIQPSSQALANAVQRTFHNLPGQLRAVVWRPPWLASALAHGALLLNSTAFWTALLVALLAATTFFVLPLLRTPVTTPSALAWVYATWMAFLVVFHLLRPWYLIPLVGLVCLAPVGRPIRRFVWVLTASMQLETLYLAHSPPFNGWQNWTTIPLLGIPLVVLLVELRREGWQWRSAATRSLVVLRTLVAWPRAPQDASSTAAPDPLPIAKYLAWLEQRRQVEQEEG